MAKLVREVMNRELFALEPGLASQQAIQEMLALGVTSAPVLDADRRAIGFVSLPDLLAARSLDTVSERMSRTVVTTHETTGLMEAALLAVRSGVHHLVVTNESGQVTGIVSTLDLLAGFVGYPAQHAPSYPHFDPATGLSWSEYAPLAMEYLPLAPDGAGVFTLTYGGKDRDEVLVWAEAAHNVRTRLFEMVSLPQADAYLSELLQNAQALRFRAAVTPDHKAACKALGTMAPRPWRPEQAFFE
ncbi:MAG TPA: CBS domain-containing protein [Polyangiaceae bacterium]